VLISLGPRWLRAGGGKVLLMCWQEVQGSMSACCNLAASWLTGCSTLGPVLATRVVDWCTHLLRFDGSAPHPVTPLLRLMGVRPTLSLHCCA
jgi:hypothetical protein